MVVTKVFMFFSALLKSMSHFPWPEGKIYTNPSILKLERTILLFEETEDLRVKQSLEPPNKDTESSIQAGDFSHYIPAVSDGTGDTYCFCLTVVYPLCSIIGIRISLVISLGSL